MSQESSGGTNIAIIYVIVIKGFSLSHFIFVGESFNFEGHMHI